MNDESEILHFCIYAKAVVFILITVDYKLTFNTLTMTHCYGPANDPLGDKMVSEGQSGQQRTMLLNRCFV